MRPLLLPIVALSLSFTPFARAVEIVAHRGASHDAPENTVASFRLGWEQKADAVELDIYLSKDGEIVVLHDATTKRTSGVDKPVIEQTLAELRTQDAGSWKAAKWAGEKIPTLDEALATIPDGKRLFIEIKCGPEVLPELQRVLAAAKRKPEQTAIIAFKYPTLVQARALFPALQLYWIVSSKPAKDSGKVPVLADLIAEAKTAKLDGLDLEWKFPLDAAAVTQVKDAGLKLYVWTVDDPAVAQRLAAAGIDGITTDRPLFLRERLASGGNTAPKQR
jgi:glycerophosphoryl diester phosphodiesterase